MKAKGYSVRVEAEAVVVEMRTSAGGFAMTIVGIVYVLFAGLFVVLANGDPLNDPGAALVLLAELLLPLVVAFGLLRAASGEVMRCDAKELQFARRRMVGRWKRFRFASSEVRGLQRAVRGSGRNAYSVVTFQHSGETFDMLESLNLGDANDVLRACKAMGVDAVVVNDPAEGMFRDIAKRGWWVNPLKSDNGE